MYSTAGSSATPRPMHAADDRKIPDHYAYPPELQDELDQRLDLRTILDVISDKETALVRSSHGRPTDDPITVHWQSLPTGINYPRVRWYVEGLKDLVLQHNTGIKQPMNWLYQRFL